MGPGRGGGGEGVGEGAGGSVGLAKRLWFRSRSLKLETGESSISLTVQAHILSPPSTPHEGVSSPLESADSTLLEGGNVQVEAQTHMWWKLYYCSQVGREPSPRPPPLPWLLWLSERPSL